MLISNSTKTTKHAVCYWWAPFGTRTRITSDEFKAERVLEAKTGSWECKCFGCTNHTAGMATPGNYRKVSLGMSQCSGSTVVLFYATLFFVLNAARETFFEGNQIKLNEIAFSDTTEDGNQFATNYCQNSDYNVYQFRSES